MTKLKKGDWAVYRNDLGYIFEGGVKSPIATHFEANSVVQILDFEEKAPLSITFKGTNNLLPQLCTLKI